MKISSEEYSYPIDEKPGKLDAQWLLANTVMHSKKKNKKKQSIRKSKNCKYYSACSMLKEMRLENADVDEATPYNFNPISLGFARI